MDAILMPTGATAMLQIIGMTTTVAAGFLVWLWRQHRRVQQSGQQISQRPLR